MVVKIVAREPGFRKFDDFQRTQKRGGQVRSFFTFSSPRTTKISPEGESVAMEKASK